MLNTQNSIRPVTSILKVLYVKKYGTNKQFAVKQTASELRTYTRNLTQILFIAHKNIVKDKQNIKDRVRRSVVMFDVHKHIYIIYN